ncbi:MAG: DUF3800 domain-containing protein [Thermoplasmata archaeon]
MRSCTVFIDESGDLGFAARSSRHITVAAIIIEDRSRLERIPLRIRKRRLKKSLLQKPELKFHNSSPNVRRAVLRDIATLDDAQILSITLDKTNAKEEDMSHREEIYLRASSELVREIARIPRVRRELTLIFDARPCNRDFGVDFDGEIEAQAINGCRAAGKIPPEVRIRRLDSVNSRGLQAADYVAGAIQRKHEIGDASYHVIVAPKIAMEKLIRL